MLSLYLDYKLSVTLRKEHRNGGEHMEYVVKNIEALRKRKGITKTHIGTYCGKTGAWYGDIVKGRRRVYLNDVFLIADAMDEDVKLFFNQKLSDSLNKNKSA